MGDGMTVRLSGGGTAGATGGVAGGAGGAIPHQGRSFIGEAIREE
jgi:hypothetical protein